MTSKSFGRLGKAPEEGIKAPCVAATVSNITLSGLQTIDGVVLEDSDRVLVKDQTVGSENGIYIASSSAWERPKDWNRDNDVTQGTLVFDANRSVIYQTTFTGDFDIDVTEPVFENLNFNPDTLDVTSTKFVATAGQTVFTVPTYVVGINAISVFLNGVKMLESIDYNETDDTTVTFLFPLTLNDRVEVLKGQQITSVLISTDIRQGNSTGGSGTAGAGNQYVELTIEGVTYKMLHDGTV